MYFLINVSFVCKAENFQPKQTPSSPSHLTANCVGHTRGPDRGLLRAQHNATRAATPAVPGFRSGAREKSPSEAPAAFGAPQGNPPAAGAGTPRALGRGGSRGQRGSPRRRLAAARETRALAGSPAAEAWEGPASPPRSSGPAAAGPSAGSSAARPSPQLPGAPGRPRRPPGRGWGRMGTDSPRRPSAIPGAAGPGRGSGNAPFNIEIVALWNPEGIAVACLLGRCGGAGAAMLYGSGGARVAPCCTAEAGRGAAQRQERAESRPRWR